MKPYPDDLIHTARGLYLRHMTVREIHQQLSIPRRTIYAWIEKYEWDSQIKTDSIMTALDRRLLTLIDKPDLSDQDLNAIDRLMQAREKECRLQGQRVSADRVFDAAQEAQQVRPLLAHAQHTQNAKRSRKDDKNTKRGKNDFRGIAPADVEAKFLEKLFQYQKDAWRTRHKRNRFILKSRQIGWTFYCAREAFADALMTGANQAFLSASKAQAQLFKRYIQAFAWEWFEVELKGGDKIVIKTDHGDATLYFLSTNSSTAQGPTGNVYIDECFWIANFAKLKSLAGAIASHKHWRKTYFSTPSTQSHEAYLLWSGAEYKANQEKRPDLPLFDMPTAKQLRQGVDCVDGIYRQVITIHDAMAGGCDLFDLEQLTLENDPDTFAQLYECRFIDDTHSAFLLADLLACGIADARWPDVKPALERPYASRPVLVGYDPSRTRDSAVITVIAAPLRPGGSFRVLEKHVLHQQNWTYQAELIRHITERYNVQHIGIDTTGPGHGVFERVQEFYPSATGIHYSLEIKTRLVLKAQEVIGQKRIAWPEHMTDIAQAFLAIRKVSTGSNITYVAARDKNIGHADAAWAIMHALISEGLNSQGARKSAYVIGA